MDLEVKRKLVISAVNFSEGGPLTILRDAVASAKAHFGNSWEIIALVHSERLITIPGITCIGFPEPKRSWLRRLCFEYWHFKKLSNSLRPDLWLSLHDITPRVTARRQAVYCHNPSPFYRISAREAWLDPTFLLFNTFYSRLYSININRNEYVVVQQDWLRDEFERRYDLANVIVAYPDTRIEPLAPSGVSDPGCLFLYPAFPRVFKNFEVIGEAVGLLREKGISGFEVQLTISGNENAYARRIKHELRDYPEIKLIGRQDQDGMRDAYSRCNTVLFPSKLETWGLPITEAIYLGKRILAADLPYARETVGSYAEAAFFDPRDAELLARLMESVIEGRWRPRPIESKTPRAPFAPTWDDLWRILSEGL